MAILYFYEVMSRSTPEELERLQNFVSGIHKRKMIENGTSKN